MRRYRRQTSCPGGAGDAEDDVLVVEDAQEAYVSYITKLIAFCSRSLLLFFRGVAALARIMREA